MMIIICIGLTLGERRTLARVFWFICLLSAAALHFGLTFFGEGSETTYIVGRLKPESKTIGANRWEELIKKRRNRSSKKGSAGLIAGPSKSHLKYSETRPAAENN
jgi:hypothetical protein